MLRKIVFGIPRLHRLSSTPYRYIDPKKRQGRLQTRLFVGSSLSVWTNFDCCPSCLLVGAIHKARAGERARIDGVGQNAIHGFCEPNCFGGTRTIYSPANYSSRSIHSRHEMVFVPIIALHSLRFCKGGSEK